mgnify:CR=1 FL=1
MTSLRGGVKLTLMKKLSLYIFLVLMFSLFTSHSFAEIKYKTYKKLPCNFNGAKVGTSTIISFKRTSRCTNWKGYPLKRGTSVMVKRGTPVFAITDMKLFYAEDRNKLRHAMKKVGLEEVRFKFDYEGTKVILS